MNDKCLYKSVCSNTTDDEICSTSCIRSLQISRLLELSNLPELYQTPTRIQ